MYADLSNAQAKTVIDAEQAFEAYRDAVDKFAAYQGGMHWKTVKGRDYLYRTFDRNGNAKSLGPRSRETEAVQQVFVQRKAELKDRVDTLAERLNIQQKVNVAFRVGHIPNEVADVCIALNRLRLMGTNFMVIGTNAMHVYSAMTGTRFDSDVMATTDVDLLWNHKSKLSLVATTELKHQGLLGLLKRADKSFEIRAGQSFRAVSKSGLMVDLIRQMPSPPWRSEPDKLAESTASDLVATDIWNMKWMLGAPKITQCVIAVDGRVLNMTCPDPRAFALFKLWLAQSDERDPRKKGRDLSQALEVIRLIEDKLPHYLNSWQSLHSFPADVVQLAVNRQ